MELTVNLESSQIKTTLDSYLNAKYSYMQIEYHITRLVDNTCFYLCTLKQSLTISNAKTILAINK